MRYLSHGVQPVGQTYRGRSLANHSRETMASSAWNGKSQPVQPLSWREVLHSLPWHRTAPSRFLAKSTRQASQAEPSELSELSPGTSLHQLSRDRNASPTLFSSPARGGNEKIGEREVLSVPPGAGVRPLSRLPYSPRASHGSTGETQEGGRPGLGCDWHETGVCEFLSDPISSSQADHIAPPGRAQTDGNNRTRPDPVSGSSGPGCTLHLFTLETSKKGRAEEEGTSPEPQRGVDDLGNCRRGFSSFCFRRIYLC